MVVKQARKAEIQGFHGENESADDHDSAVGKRQELAGKCWRCNDKYQNEQGSGTPSLIPCLGEISVHDLGKKAVWPIHVDAVARSVKFLHVSPQAEDAFLHRYLEVRDSLVRNLGHMLHIVEEGHGIMIGP